MQRELWRRPAPWFVVAAVAGGLHAAATFYWAAGGRRLLATLGEIASAFEGRLWLLAPFGVLKLTAAVGPLWLNARGWPLRHVTRSLSWLASAVLIVWGGLNTVIGGAVLMGVLAPGGGYDRDAMIGHAFLWDPLFLLWGAALLVGLLCSRTAR